MTDFVLTAENYHSNEANKLFMSCSQYKSFISCEASAMNDLNKPDDEDEAKHFLLGKYGHKAAENGKHIEYLMKNFGKFQNAGLIGKKGTANAEIRQFDETIIPLMQNDSAIQAVLTGEKEVIITFDLFGIKWKAQIDVLNLENSFFCDLKFMRDTKKQYNERVGYYQNFIEFWGYDLQIAIYSYGIKQFYNLMDYLLSSIVCITKEKVPKRLILTGFNEELINEKLFTGDNAVQNNIDRIIMVKNGELEPNNCGDCDFCRKTMKTQIMNWWELDG